MTASRRQIARLRCTALRNCSNFVKTEPRCHSHTVLQEGYCRKSLDFSWLLWRAEVYIRDITGRKRRGYSAGAGSAAVGMPIGNEILQCPTVF
jgi:hypothetical protein